MPDPACPTILIVDDDQGLLRLVEKVLKREGFSTASAGSGEEAREWLLANRADLLLLDLGLRDMEGGHLVELLSKVGRAVPFVVITGRGDERIAVEMMKRGALDYLVKDVRFVDFVPTVVRRALEQVEKDRQLGLAQAALKESQDRLLVVSERERTRFGAELHDNLGQQLTAIELRCQSLRQDLPPSRPDLEKQVSEICRFLREAIAQTRSLARSLSPVNLGSGGLVEALAELGARMSRDGRIQCRVDLPADLEVRDELVAGHLFRIAQEAVDNSVKHSDGTEIGIRLRTNGGVLRLEISDNGKGLPKSMQPTGGLGLELMKHRAGVIGGELEIASNPGSGVNVTCIWREDRP